MVLQFMGTKDVISLVCLVVYFVYLVFHAFPLYCLSYKYSIDHCFGNYLIFSWPNLSVLVIEQSSIISIKILFYVLADTH